MQLVYNFCVWFLSKLLPILGKFNPKLKLFCQGRNEILPTLSQKISPTDRPIWVHTASLGEYEQGLPIIEALKKQFPSRKIVVSFFSPSGYEVKKNSNQADVFIYLPWDTPQQINSFLNALNPSLAVFVKYEFWANCLTQTHKRGIPLYLVSGIFRPNQIFFKWYGGFFRRILTNFDAIFVQNKQSQELLQTLQLPKVILSSDTRFDRVLKIREQENSLPFIEEFKNNSLCVVIGSSWAEDEELFIPFINSVENVKFIIAPHQIHPEKINQLRQKIKKTSVLFSEKDTSDLASAQVFIINTIGILTKIYAYADIAYVGGGMKTGLHNILEPAVFGIPVIIGKEFSKFAEAVDLVNLGGVISVETPEMFTQTLEKLAISSEYRSKLGKICGNYIKQKAGATEIFMSEIFSKEQI